MIFIDIRFSAARRTKICCEFTHILHECLLQKVPKKHDKHDFDPGRFQKLTWMIFSSTLRNGFVEEWRLDSPIVKIVYEVSAVLETNWWGQIGACLIHKWISLVNYSADTYKLASRLAAGLVHYYNAYTSRQMRVYFWEESCEADIAIGNKFDIR